MILSRVRGRLSEAADSDNHAGRAYRCVTVAIDETPASLVSVARLRTVLGDGAQRAPCSMTDRSRVSSSPHEAVAAVAVGGRNMKTADCRLLTDQLHSGYYVYALILTFNPKNCY